MKDERGCFVVCRLLWCVRILGWLSSCILDGVARLVKTCLKSNWDAIILHHVMPVKRQLCGP